MSKPWTAALLATLLAIGAGLVSGLMLAALARRGAGSLALIYFLPLPLFVAGLSQGALAVGIATLAGSAVVLLLADGWRALWFLVVLGGPTCWLIRQALLSREAAEPGGAATRQWYPPGLLLGWL